MIVNSATNGFCRFQPLAAKQNHKKIGFKGQEILLPDTKEKFDLIDKEIAKQDKIAIFVHSNPDGDALGSAAGLKKIILAKYPDKKVTIFVNSIPQALRYLQEKENFQIVDKDADIEHLKNENYGLAIAVDMSNKKQIELCKKKLYKFFDSFENKIKIDHHPVETEALKLQSGETSSKTSPDNINFGKINLVCPNASSNTQIIMQFADYLGVNLDKEMASDFYLGLVTDTAGFRYIKKMQKPSDISQDSVELINMKNAEGVFQDSAKLAATGINTDKIYKQSMDLMNKASFQLYRDILNNVRFSEDGKINYVIDDYSIIKDPNSEKETLIPKTINKYGLTSGSVKDVFSKVLGIVMPNIEGVETSTCLTEEENSKGAKETRGSICTVEGAKVNARTLAEIYGGGGHKPRAGFARVQSSAKEILAEFQKAISTNTPAEQG